MTAAAPAGSHEPTLAYLSAATAGVRRYANLSAARSAAPCRRELDALHTLGAALYTALARLSDRSRQDAGPDAPATLHLASAATRLWQSTDRLHAAYHASALLDACLDADTALDQQPPLTICQRHLTATTAARLRTTPAETLGTPHGQAAPAPGSPS